MTALRLLIATSHPPALARLVEDLRASPELVLVGQAADLSACYIQAERHEPEVALVGEDLVRSADFEGLVSLFRVIGTAWLPLQLSGLAATGPSVTRREPGGAAGPALPAGLPRPALVRALMEARATLAARRGEGRADPPDRPALAASAETGASSAPPRRTPFHPDSLILIGASTGGIDALLQVLSAFPADCPPTAIVQHTGQSFSDSLIRLFARCSAARVVAAAPGVLLTPGTVVVGAGCPGHLQLRPGRPLRADVVAGQLVSGHMPSVDALFRSALPFAPSVTAALLTGMGRDGAQGLAELRRAGARTLAQDEATSVVYGMPRAAAELGAAEAVLPIGRIAAELLSRAARHPAEITQR
jgi:two-component system chemotaxis response regulator CheB